MKKIILLLVILIVHASYFANAQAPSWQWAKNGVGYGDEYGYSVTTDASGNVYMAGQFESSTVTFGTITLTNLGYSDLFIVKYDPNGNVVWAKSAGGADGDYLSSIKTDANGNVFMSGSFSSQNITFGSITLNNSVTLTNPDIFLVKYDNNGNEIWAKSAGEIDYEYSNCISIDPSGNIYSVGSFSSSTVTFGTTTLTNSGSNDIFIVKYNTNGTVLWAKRAGGLSNDMALGCCNDANGNLYITGSFTSGTLPFGTTTLVNAGAQDLFIAKYNGTTGSPIWAKSSGGTSEDYGKSIATDASGNIYLLGNFRSPTITFGTSTFTNLGVFDICIVKYNTNGSVVWANNISSPLNENGNSISSDAIGRLLIAGTFQTPTITFGTTTITNTSNIGYTDAFVAKYNALGRVLWAKNAGGNKNDQGNSVCSDLNGNVYLSGTYDSPTVNFGTTTLTKSSVPFVDAFISKLDITTVGIEEMEMKTNVSIHPNPFSFETTITFLDEQKNRTIKIIDLLGKELKTHDFSGKQFKLEKDELKPGVYLVQIVDENKDVISKKIVVQ